MFLIFISLSFISIFKSVSKLEYIKSMNWNYVYQVQAFWILRERGNLTYAIKTTFEWKGVCNVNTLYGNVLLCTSCMQDDTKNVIGKTTRNILHRKFKYNNKSKCGSNILLCTISARLPLFYQAFCSVKRSKQLGNINTKIHYKTNATNIYSQS